MRPSLRILGVCLAMAGAACAPKTGPSSGFSLPEASTLPGSATTQDQANTTVTIGPEGVPDYTSAVELARVAAEAAIGGQYGTEEFGLTMQQLTAKIEQVEPLIGECMAAAGFEYVPVNFATIRSAMISDKTAPGLSGAEYLAQYGHGITTQPDKPVVEIGLGQQNQRILANLNPADQVAYKRTLFGGNPTATFAYGLESEDFSRAGGCTRTAVERVFTTSEMASTYFNPADALVEQDPRAQAALHEWAVCLSEAGFVYRHPDDIDTDLQLRYNSITQGQDPAELTGLAHETLLDLQDEERAVATANAGCERSILDPVLDQIEAEFFGRN